METEQQTAINKLIADEKELTRQGVVLDFVKTRVDTLDKKFDVLLEKMDGKYALKEEVSLLKENDKDKEIRLRSVEDFNSVLMGRMWGVGILVGIIISVLTLIINHFWK